MVGAEQFERHHLQVRLNFPNVRDCLARVASPPLPKRNAANVLLEHSALTVSLVTTNGVLNLGQGVKGRQEEFRRIALIRWNGKDWVVEQPRARGRSQRRVGVDPPAVDRESRGLSSERARRARCGIKTTVVDVDVEELTEGCQAQKHLRDRVHEASLAVEVANAHA